MLLLYLPIEKKSNCKLTLARHTLSPFPPLLLRPFIWHTKEPLEAKVCKYDHLEVVYAIKHTHIYISIYVCVWVCVHSCINFFLIKLEFTFLLPRESICLYVCILYNIREFRQLFDLSIRFAIFTVFFLLLYVCIILCYEY